MDNSNNESFIRWQERSINQMSFTNNLFITLSAGMTAFLYPVVIEEYSCLLVASIIFYFLSILAGSIVAMLRHKSFRATAQIARKRENGDANESSVLTLRQKTKRLDNCTISLMNLQWILFLLGILSAIIHLFND